MAPQERHDVLVVGVGFAGLYALYLLKQQGLDVKAIDSAADVGGTWYWNRYPGARSDVESHVYRYSWDKELLQDSPFPNNYLTQPELQSYFQQVATKHDLYRHIQFNATLQKATWDEGRKVWTAKVSTGEIITARYLVTGIGLVHVPHVPDIPGLDTFEGQVTHSSRWTPDVQYKDRRVAVIGSGASGVQLASALSGQAKTLTHFIRHAQYVLPAALRTVSKEERKRINEEYDKIWRQVFTSTTGFGFPEPLRPTFSVTPEDREAIFEDLWSQGSGFRFLFGGFSDIATDEAANKEAIRFIHRKIKETVKDPQKAEVLTSSDWFARRPLTDDGYYKAFNRDNVLAVDLKKTPITGVTAEGIQTADGHVTPLDLIVFATGFDAVDGGFFHINIRGREGKSLKDHWGEFPHVQLGVATSGFPNLLFVNGPGSPFSNNPPASEEAARFVADLIAHAEDLRKANGEDTPPAVVESTQEADEKWTEGSNEIAEGTLFAKTNSWFFGENIPGRKKAARLHFGGLSRYRATLSEARLKGFPGFEFRF